jgi:hypothetical protein
VIDVVPVADGLWLAHCECGATEHFADSEQGWAWVLTHPCPEEAAETEDSEDSEDDAVIDLTDRNDCHKS